MKILFATPEFVTEEKNFDGGLSNYVYRTTLSLIGNGHEAIVMVISNTNEIINYNGIEVHRIQIDYENSFIRIINLITFKKFHQTIETLYRSYVLRRNINNYLKDNSVNIIQYSNYLSLGFFRPKVIPVVVRISSFQPELRESYGNKNPSLDTLITEWLDLNSMKRADGIYGPSELNAKRIGTILKKGVKVIENPFQLENVKYDYSLYDEKLKNKKYLLFFGSVGDLKGVGTISRVIKQILALEGSLYFVFVGKDMGVVDSLMKSAGELRDRVIWIDKIHHNLLYPIISNSYSVVLPSLSDNFPNTCLEAMAHSKVVIGTQGTSIEQLIEDGKNGFLINIDDSQGLLDKVEKLLNLEKSTLTSMGAKAKARVDMISPDNQVPILIQYYNEIISNFDN